MLIRSSDLSDEIDALNAIYGENTVTVTFHNHHHTTIVLKLPDLTYGFLLQIPGTYPNSIPRVMGVDDLVQSREFGVQESATYLHACISGVYQHGSVCLYDAIDELAPMLDRQKQQRQYKNREDAMEVLTQQSMALRDLAVRARRRSLQFQDGIDDNFPGVSDCAACMEPFFKILMTHLQCQHSFCPNCLYEGILSALRGQTEFKCCGKSIPLREFRKISNLDDDFVNNYSKWLQELHCPNPLYLGNITLVSENGKASAAYEALSYASGDPKDTKEIQLNGWSFTVFGNLFLALSQLRFPETERLLWVDQLCINQIDIPERNSSVLLMCDIYRQATSTVVWLGPAKDGTIQAVQFVNEFLELHREDLRQHLLRYVHETWSRERATLKEQTQFSDEGVDFLLSKWFWQGLPRSYGLENSEFRDYPVAKAIHWMKNFRGDASKKTIILSIDEMLSRDWWKRCWTLQEAVVSETLVLQCGSSCLRWDDLTLFSDVFTVISTWQVTEKGEGAMADISPFLNSTLSGRSLMRSLVVKRRLLDLLHETRDLRASDRRDQVYSVLGILGKQKRRAYGIKPNYSDTNRVADVMATVAKAAVQTDHKWPFAYLSGQEAGTDFPTWVPDFHETEYSYNGLVANLHRFQAGKNLWLNPSFFDNGRRMKVSAIKLGIVEVIHKPSTSKQKSENVLQEWYRLVMKRARDHEEPCSLRLLKEFLEVVYNLDPAHQGPEGELRLPKQHDWQSPTNLDQEALDRIFTQVRSFESQGGEPKTIKWRSDFFILQDGSMGLIPLQFESERLPGEVGDIVYVLPSLNTPLMVRTATKAKGCFTVVRLCLVQGVMDGEVIDMVEQGEKMLEEIDLI
ncbi:hypothetical protein LTR20_007001 [Exophiala xenobiotica]|nr:hypothetical protein LTR40_005039 [Exophiala xenobiotica]KAK5380556.1 hypothetical protein LTS13_003415 [Exophiala xenobiotica]KAK5392950.1 hypothetical protein LTR79_009853 [Exophiala xenobiotica]KAK5412005.1 hypothetical protein LTR90_007566 [Exophiala xenobiotica]KAK5460576.1 hypothetical protein LTR20_007001 [Exophiala xenobiotica]